MPNINFDAAFEEDSPESIPVETEVVSSTPFDSKLELTKVINSFEAVEKQIVAMKTQVQSLKITDATSFTNAGERLIQCRQITKLVAKLKKDNKSYSEAKKLIDATNKFIRENLTSHIKDLEDTLNYKIREYSKAEAEIQKRIAEKRAKEEEEKRRKLIEIEKEKERKRLETKRAEALARQKKLDEDAEKAGVDKVKVDIPEVPDEIEIDESAIVIDPVIEESGTAEKIKISGGAAKIKAKWDVEIIDAKSVPREYCVPDIKLLKKAVDSGVKNIAGCRIFEDFKMDVRVSSKDIDAAVEKTQHKELPWG